MGLKGSDPFFQRSMANKVLAGYVTRICELYIDDVLIHGPTDNEYLAILARYWDDFVKRNSQPYQQRQDSVSRRLNMLGT